METRYLFNDQIITEIYKLIDEAKEYVYLITPYFELIGHLESHLERAKAKVTLIIRDEKLDEKTKAIADFKRIGVDVRSLKNLHAKIYLNENRCIISSMNLYGHSVVNSEEIAVLVDDKDGLNKIYMHVKENLFNRSKSLAAPVPSQRKLKREDRAGYCIRCGTQIRLDPSKPYCLDCYDSWSDYANPVYKEKFCHNCGKKGATSMSRPLCRKCFSKT